MSNISQKYGFWLILISSFKMFLKLSLVNVSMRSQHPHLDNVSVELGKQEGVGEVLSALTAHILDLTMPATPHNTGHPPHIGPSIWLSLVPNYKQMYVRISAKATQTS